MSASENGTIFGARVYLDSVPSVANASDIGLYGVAGENSQFRWIMSDISPYSPTVTWKTGVLTVSGIGDIEESVDLMVGGNLPRIGGTEVRVANTLEVGGSFTQFDRVLSDNDIRLNGLAIDIVRFDISSGAIDDADGSVVYRGVCADVEWTEQTFTLVVESPSLSRRSNIGTIIDSKTYPDAGEDSLGKMIPVTFGEFLPERDTYGNIAWNGYARFQRVDNKERTWTPETLGGVHGPSGLTVFPVVWPVESTGTPLRYRIKFGTSYAGPSYPKNLVGQYLKVVEGAGQGSYRRINRAVVIGVALLELDIDDYFESTLQGNATANATDQTWVKIVDIPRSYMADVWPCENYLDSDGNAISSGLELYAYDSDRSITVSGEAETVRIQETQETFRRLPSYAYEDSGNGNKNRVDLDVKMFDSDTDNVNAFIVKPVQNVEGFGGDADTWFVAGEKDRLSVTVDGINDEISGGVDYRNATKFADGIYRTMFDPGYIFPIALMQNPTNTMPNGNAYDKDDDTYSELSVQFTNVGGAALEGVAKGLFIVEYTLPTPPENFEFDTCYVGIKAGLEVVGDPLVDLGDAVISFRERRFIGDRVLQLDSGFDEYDAPPAFVNRQPTIDNLPDFYYSGVDTANKNFYVLQDDTYHRGNDLTGYTLCPLSAANKEEYENIYRCAVCVPFSCDASSSGWTNVTVRLKVYEVATIFKKTVSIRDTVYSPFRGRIYQGSWGQTAGSSSSSSSSSSQSSPSSSSSSSSSSQSSPSSSSSSLSSSSSSSSSLSSSSSSSSSQSSPSSSSSSSSSSSLVARKTATSYISNPVDIAEHVLRLQNWSEQQSGVDWGHAYPNVPLIDVSTNDGGFDFEGLQEIKNIKPAWQIQEYGGAWTNEIMKKICRGFFCVNYQNPTNGEERISFFAGKSLSTPATTITLGQIVGPISSVRVPESSSIYCEPYVRYAKNQGSGQYDKIIRIRNAGADSYNSDYVDGLDGTTAEIMWTKAHVLWQSTRRIEEPPSDMTDHDIIYRDVDAVWYLDTWLSWMGAIDTDGTPSGVEFDPKKRISFSVPYDTGKDWYIMQHHKLQLPHQTDATSIEFVIEKIKREISRGKNLITVQAVLYGQTTEIDLYIKDTWVDGTLLDDWKDNYQTLAERGTGGDDITDIY